MRECPNCHLQIEEEIESCPMCGFQIILGNKSTLHLLWSDINMGEKVYPSVHEQKVDEVDNILRKNISLILENSGATIELSGKGEYILGRFSENKVNQPDIDLSPYNAYALGISRIHAVIKVKNFNLSIMDLESSNGTRINKQQIMSKVEYPLNDGDLITLGQCDLRLNIKIDTDSDIEG